MSRDSSPLTPGGVPAPTWATAILVGMASIALVGWAATSSPARRAALTASVPAAVQEVPVELDEPLTHPGVPADEKGLALEMARRLELAQAAARKDGVTLRVNSGWRTLRRQAVLYRRALASYRSATEARRWVLPPEKSEHPQGRALDIGPPPSAQWLGREGYRFGLCRRYANEPWHFEPLTWPGEKCPPLERDANGD